MDLQDCLYNKYITDGFLIGTSWSTRELKYWSIVLGFLPIHNVNFACRQSFYRVRYTCEPNSGLKVQT